MLGKIVYWIAVLAISVGLLVALVLFFEARDDPALGGAPGALLGAERAPD